MFPIGTQVSIGPKSARRDSALFLPKPPRGSLIKIPLLTIIGLAQNLLGLLRGAYHFFRCNVDAKKQADYFIDYVKSVKDDCELPPVLDLETNDGVNKEKIVPAAKVWLDRVEAAFGKKPIIYSGQYFLQDYLDSRAAVLRLGKGLSALAGAISESICGRIETVPPARLVHLDILAIQRQGCGSMASMPRWI